MKQIFITLSTMSLFLQLPCVIFAQEHQIVGKIIEIAKKDNQTTMHRLDVLINRIGGRPIGSDVYRQTTDNKQPTLIFLNE